MSKILIVDDEQDILEALSRHLVRRGYEVDTAQTGEEGIEKARKKMFDVAVLDVVLPGMDGVRVLEQLKKIDPNIEVVITTGFATITVAVDSMKKGAYDYVEKPISPDRISALIEKSLERRQLTETVALYEISKAIFSTIDIDKLLEIIVDLGIKTLRADDASIMLFDEAGKLYIAISRGLDEDTKNKTRLALGDRIAGWVAENKQPLILINGLTNDERFAGIRGREEIKSAMVIPLLKNDKVLGILCINRLNISDNFSKTDLYKSNIFASLSSLALDNANIYKKLFKAQNELAMTKDALEQKVQELSTELERLKKKQ